jgi:hypothetical protein
MSAARVLEGQLMPRPWFRAQLTAGALFGIYKTGMGLGRTTPLAEGERALADFTLPPFQRPPVWSLAQKVRFIESIWQGLPLGAYVVNRVVAMDGDLRYDGWLLDGQQRITAIVEYVADAFPVMGYRWSGLTKGDRRQFDMTPMSYLETQLTDPVLLREVYERLAYGGTAHEPSQRYAGAPGSGTMV